MFSRQVIRAARVAAPQRALALRAAPVRSFAAAASSEVKPPVSVFGVDGTYATALVIQPTFNKRTKKLRTVLFRPFLYVSIGFPRGAN
jgi:hypothetical protein